MSAEAPLGGVAATALLTAYARAQETLRPDRLFDDPLARRFVTEATGANGAAGERLPRMGMATDDGTSPLWEAFGSYFVIRTPFFDDGVRAALARGPRQVVILAAGMDARAFRLDLGADTTVFEVDQPEVLAFKERVLAGSGQRPRCVRTPVPADLLTDWATPLAAAGFDAAAPTVWLVEGLVAYLVEADCHRLRDALTRLSAPGSHLLVDYAARPPESAVVDRAVDGAEQGMVADIVDMGRPGPGVDPDGWLGPRGWSTVTTTAVAEFARLGRALPGIADETAADVPAWLAHATFTGP